MPTRYIMPGKYVPTNPGELLHFIGQDVDSIAEYAGSVTGGASVSGITTYTGIRDDDNGSLRGLWRNTNYGAGRMNAKELLSVYPHAALSIGLDIRYTLKSIADGKRDKVIVDLAHFIREAKRPVFLRIGYECDGPWNKYEPEAYKAAFRRIVDVIRAQGVYNFASVWQCATSAMGTYKNRKIWDWWPGRDVVDWCGLSYFVPHKQSLDELLKFARHHLVICPVMICESAPQGFDLANLTVGNTDGSGDLRPVTTEQIWKKWYIPYFAFIRENYDVIRAVSYISANWNAQPMWKRGGKHGYWGDTRANANGEIQRRWEMEITHPSWMRTDLFSRLSIN